MSRHSNRHTAEAVQGAFKILMTRWILQFAWRIAFRCVLHRCRSQDIHCWKCLDLFGDKCLHKCLSYIWWRRGFVFLNEPSKTTVVHTETVRTTVSDGNCVWFRGSEGRKLNRNHYGLLCCLFLGFPVPSIAEQGHEGLGVVMILPQVHLRKPCYDFTFL